MILMNDFKLEPNDLKRAMLNAAERVITSGWYILGGELEAFERQWSKTCSVNYGVGVGNGMDAIEIGLRSISIGPGDEVITTSMTAFATVLAILRAGAVPVLADIDPQTALMSIDSVKRCISPKTKAILLVHLYGQIKAMDEWQELCKAHNIFLLEDCAQCHLAAWKGEVAGSFGEWGAYSFYPTKNLGALGDAGMLVTQNKSVAERAARLRNYGQSVRYHHPQIGMNSRLDEMQAAILMEKAKWLYQFTNQRQGIAAKYNLGITSKLVNKLALPDESGNHVYHLYVITSKWRDELQAVLAENSIQSYIHYPIPIHHQEPCQSIKRDPFGLAKSESHSNECLSLPCHPQLTDEEIQTVINVVNNFKIK